jgi:orotidine-5'-phosphate decarboxylase
MSNPKEKIIFALDVDHFSEAQRWVKLLKDQVGVFKVGKQLFTHSGPKVIDMILQKGQKVFLDLKFHDIPNTVARAEEGATKLNVTMFNLHTWVV